VNANLTHLEHRFDGIDLLKALAVFCVILIHFNPWPESVTVEAAYFVRFAVPYFFIVNGFLFGLGVQRHGLYNQTIWTVGKLSKIYVLWWLIYFLFPSGGEIRNYGFIGSYSSRWENVAQSYEHFLFYGPTTHLWYFPALLCALIAIYLLASTRMRMFQWPLALGFYILGVLGGSYANSDIGLSLPLNHRHFLFFSLLPVLLGFTMSFKAPFKYQAVVGIFIFLVGFVCHRFEVIYLFTTYQIPLKGHDYLFSTVWMAFGVFMLAMVLKTQGRLKLLNWFGQISGGIYLIHIFVLQKIPYLQPFMSEFIWTWASPFLAFGISAFGIFILKRIKFLRGLVP
jgi:surface polysaccharide O-acyltransferase-like enzyme